MHQNTNNSQNDSAQSQNDHVSEDTQRLYAGKVRKFGRPSLSPAMLQRNQMNIQELSAHAGGIKAFSARKMQPNHFLNFKEQSRNVPSRVESQKPQIELSSHADARTSSLKLVSKFGQPADYETPNFGSHKTMANRFSQVTKNSGDYLEVTDLQQKHKATDYMRASFGRLLSQTSYRAQNAYGNEQIKKSNQPLSQIVKFQTLKTHFGEDVKQAVQTESLQAHKPKQPQQQKPTKSLYTLLSEVNTFLDKIQTVVCELEDIHLGPQNLRSLARNQSLQSQRPKGYPRSHSSPVFPSSFNQVSVNENNQVPDSDKQCLITKTTNSAIKQIDIKKVKELQADICSILSTIVSQKTKVSQPVPAVDLISNLTKRPFLSTLRAASHATATHQQVPMPIVAPYIRTPEIMQNNNNSCSNSSSEKMHLADEQQKRKTLWGYKGPCKPVGAQCTTVLQNDLDNQNHSHLDSNSNSKEQSQQQAYNQVGICGSNTIQADCLSTHGPSSKRGKKQLTKMVHWSKQMQQRSYCQPEVDNNNSQSQNSDQDDEESVPTSQQQKQQKRSYQDASINVDDVHQQDSQQMEDGKHQDARSQTSDLSDQTLHKQSEECSSQRSDHSQRKNILMTTGTGGNKNATSKRGNAAPMNPDGTPIFQCEQCQEVFDCGQALGGHMSRSHPGESGAYNRKIKRREERAYDRELLRLAKIQHQQLYGPDAEINRVKIRRFKKEIGAKIKKGIFVPGFNTDMLPSQHQ